MAKTGRFLFYFLFKWICKIFKTGINFGELVRISKTTDLYMFYPFLQERAVRETPAMGDTDMPQQFELWDAKQLLAARATRVLAIQENRVYKLASDIQVFSDIFSERYEQREVACLEWLRIARGLCLVYVFEILRAFLFD